MYNLIFGIITGTDNNNNNKMFNTIIEQLNLFVDLLLS